MALKRSAAHIAVLNRLALAAAGGCYVGAPPRPAARSMKFFSLLCPVTPNIAGTACIKACLSLFPRRVSAHCIHWTAGKRQFRLQSKHGVRCGADAECSLPAGHAQRSRRREQSERPGGGVRTRVPYEVKQQTHSEAAGVSRANDQAEVCGHACLAVPGSGSIRKFHLAGSAACFGAAYH